ncbi:hypothetical protein [Helicobacter suis]|uniref:hypothetical protein n=1 Tax=Helicobacter suis TaxID=104628 RepID=UPI0013D85BA6|nr:hypothetical protein [Helicobacter suis]
MPLPFILGGIALAIAGYGVKKGVDAYENVKEAEEWHQRARSHHGKSKQKLEEAQGSAQKAFEKLGNLQKMIVNTSLERYKDIVDKCKIKDDVNWQKIVDKESLQHLGGVCSAIVDLETMLNSVAGSAAAGAIAGFGAWGAAGLVGSASTGTALSVLSGAAATNATLAWFGGGSLAAGGFGMAAGSLVLGGLVAAPVIAVTASVFANKAEERKDDAQSYYHSVCAACECMEAEGLAWHNLCNRAQEKIAALLDLNVTFVEVLDVVEQCMEAKGFDCHKWSGEEQEQIKTLIQQAETLTTIISAPLMHDDDPLTQEIKEHREACQDLMDNIQAKWG